MADYSWTKIISTNNGDFIGGIAVASNGYAYVTGNTFGSSFYGRSIKGVDAAYLMKLSLYSGDLLWVRTIEGTSNDQGVGVATDSSNKSYVLVNGENISDINSSGQNVYLIKFDESGKSLWTKIYQKTIQDIGRDIIYDGDDSIYTAGQSWTGASTLNSNNLKGFLNRYDLNGELIWSKPITLLGVTDVYSITNSKDGFIYAAGVTSDGYGNSGPLQSDAYVAKYSASGKLVWVKDFVTDNDDAILDIATDSFGNLYAVGSSRGDFNGIKNDGLSDGFLMKISPSGDVIWTKNITSSLWDSINSISINTSDGIHVSGYTSGQPFVAQYNVSGDSISFEIVDEDIQVLSSGLGDNLLAIGTVGFDSRNFYGEINLSYGEFQSAFVAKISDINEGDAGVDLDQGAFLEEKLDDQDSSGGNQKLDESLGPGTIQINTLSVIVDLFGEILYLKDLVESITSETHTIEYSGIVFNWSEVDAFVTTVIRNGEFTEEFAKEIADAYPSVTGISYTTAVTLVGSSAIEDVLIAVAGADGDFIG